MFLRIDNSRHSGMCTFAPFSGTKVYQCVIYKINRHVFLYHMIFMAFLSSAVEPNARFIVLLKWDIMS